MILPPASFTDFFFLERMSFRCIIIKRQTRFKMVFFFVFDTRIIIYIYKYRSLDRAVAYTASNIY